MKYQELKIGETYLYNNKEYKVLYKHDETQSVFTFNELSNTTTNFHKDYLFDLKPKVKSLPERGLLRGYRGSLIYRTNKTRGYGFNSYNGFKDSSFYIFDNGDWKEATKEDYVRFKELVIEHLKGLGFNDGDSFYSLFAWGNRNINFGGDIGFDENGIYIDNIYVYCENKWIQPISAKETEKEKLKALLNQMKDLLDSM